MALDPANYISELSPADPPGTDPASQADDHLRAIKKAIKQSFPGTFDAALNLSPTEIEALPARLTALEAIPIILPPAPVGGQLIVPTSVTPVSVVGLGFQPSVVLFMATVDSVGPWASYSIGVADGVFQNATHTSSSLVDNTDVSQVSSNVCYAIDQTDINPPQLNTRGSLTSMDADGFTITPLVAVHPCFLMWMAWA